MVYPTRNHKMYERLTIWKSLSAFVSLQVLACYSYFQSLMIANGGVRE